MMFAHRDLGQAAALLEEANAIIENYLSFILNSDRQPPAFTDLLLPDTSVRLASKMAERQARVCCLRERS